MLRLNIRSKSGTYKKASQLREKSIELKKIRKELSSLLMVRNSMDSNTADGQADNERFFYLVTACVYDYETQKPVFSSLEDYQDRAETELGVKCASEFANFAYGLEENFEDTLIENKLLKKLGLLNDDGELTNKQGQRVDLEGNLLNEEGARVDKDGNRIDINNNPVLEDSVIDELEIEDDLEDVEVQDKKSSKRKPRSSSAKNEDVDEDKTNE